MEFISRTINNRPTLVSPHATVLQACEAAGVDIPRFCYHEKLSVAGNCRRCLVEIQKSPKPVVACARPVTKGRVVFTNTPLVRKARESVLEFLLVNHPLDCPICDQGGECDLQDEAVTYGSDRGRYFEFKRSVEDKECGPVVKTIRTRCIHCTRCVRFSTEVAGNEVMGAFGRGEEMEIGTYIHTFLKTELSGNLVDLCPVGALTSKPYAYQARSWELQRIDTLDFFDALASDIVVHTRKRTTPLYVDTKVRFSSQEEILRILPRLGGLYAENWISDRTRYAFDGLKQARVQQPIRSGAKGRTGSRSQTWTDRLASLWATVALDSDSSFVVGTQVNLERVYALSTFAKLRGTNSISQGYAPARLNVDFPFFYSLNRSFSSFAKNELNGLIMIGTNLRYEASLLNTRLRREQSRSGLSYLTVGSYASLQYAQRHSGNSFRSIYALLENRVPSVKARFLSVLPVAVLLGVDSLRGHYSFFLQQGVRALGKNFFVKTAQKDRLGYVHSSIGSLAFAHLGFSSQTPKTTDVTTLFSVNAPSHSESFFKWSAFSEANKNRTEFSQLVIRGTHYSSEISVNKSAITKTLPLTSFYEREGSLVVLEGRKRKHVKAVSAPVAVRSLETILSALCIKQGSLQWCFWNEGLGRFNADSPRENLLETTPVSFAFNPFELKVFSSTFAKLILFSSTVHDFYLQEPIATNSQTMAECSLFFGQEINFNLNFLLFYIIL